MLNKASLALILCVGIISTKDMFESGWIKNRIL